MQTIKEEMREYWTERVEGFSQLRMKEFFGEKRQLWMAEFQKVLPEDRTLNILDLGTGTGYFAFLLAAQGHQVTGIDLTEGMIQEARREAEQLERPVCFHVMDAENPDYAPESFDVLVTRNLTWALPNLPRAYANWQRLLKKGGMLINFDADYCREDPARCIPENHAHKNISPSWTASYEHMKEELRPLQRPRPAWDRELLDQAGFQDVQVDSGVWKRIYAQYDEFYNPTPIFMITAKT